MTSYVYTQSEPGLYTVGFYAPDGGWNPESDHTSIEQAAARIHYLNGGESINDQRVERLIDAVEQLRVAIDRAANR
jgi:hypothetical protein